MPKPRALLADDHSMMLAGLHKLVEETCEVVGTVGDGRALVEAAQRLEPDVIILDIVMPSLNTGGDILEGPGGVIRTNTATLGADAIGSAADRVEMELVRSAGRPTGLAAEPGGSLLVVDRHVGRVLVLDADGQVTGVGSRKGWEPGLLLFPAGIARLPGGLVVVADEGNGRAQLFRRSPQGAGP